MRHLLILIVTLASMCMAGCDKPPSDRLLDCVARAARGTTFGRAETPPEASYDGAAEWCLKNLKLEREALARQR